MSLIVGCPVRQRTWVLPRWFEAVETAAHHAEVAVHYLFVCDLRDPATEAVQALAQEWTRTITIVPIEEDVERSDERRWGDVEPLQHMVFLRNVLLGAVREARPTHFLSLDSDILIAPMGLANLLESMAERDFDAVGGRTYMTPHGRSHPSWAQLTRSYGLHRLDADGVFPADVIMAIKLMAPRAYGIDYRYDIQGEDVGWSIACREAGVRLGFDGRVANKHCMSPPALDFLDDRVGY